MTIVDAAFGFPVCLVQLGASFVVCLAFCFIMIVCYDLEEKAALDQERDEDDNDAEQPLMARDENDGTEYRLLEATAV